MFSDKLTLIIYSYGDFFRSILFPFQKKEKKSQACNPVAGKFSVTRNSHAKPETTSSHPGHGQVSFCYIHRRHHVARCLDHASPPRDGSLMRVLFRGKSEDVVFVEKCSLNICLVDGKSESVLLIKRFSL